MMILFASDLYFAPSNFDAHSSIPLFVSCISPILLCLVGAKSRFELKNRKTESTQQIRILEVMN